ncbi:MAG: OmpA family protein [Planctomycetaceae bacterium]|jgi:flagellar motor protein MotB|nr:OmpA family protein [Planctomycetaceae bacterium]
MFDQFRQTVLKKTVGICRQFGILLISLIRPQYSKIFFLFAVLFFLFVFSSCSSLNAQRKGELSPLERQNADLVAKYQEEATKAKSLDVLNEQVLKDLGQASRVIQQAEYKQKESEQRVADLTAKIEALELQLAESQQSIKTYQASMYRQSTVTVTPNSSYKNQLAISSPDVKVVNDGDYVRVRIPNSMIFHAGTWQLTEEGKQILNEVGNQLRVNFPDQEIGVEGHVSQMEVNRQSVLSDYEAGIKNAFAATYYLITNRILEEKQIRIGGAGANRPVENNAVYENENNNARIEFVVYPTSWR